MKGRPRRLLICSALALLLLGVLGAGHHYVWWGPEPPHDPAALVLRVEFVGGMGRSDHVEIPEISVYGDGRVVTRGTDFSTIPSRTVVHDQRLTGLAYRQVYRDAHLAGLASSRTFEPDGQINDGGVTLLTLLADGRRQVSTMHAGAGGARVWLIHRLVGRLGSPPRGDLVAAPVPYRPARMAIVTWREPATDAGERATAWPLRLLPAGQGNESCGILTGAEADAAVAIAGSASPDTRWRSGPDLFLVYFRPLLPDETDCSAVLR